MRVDDAGELVDSLAEFLAQTCQRLDLRAFDHKVDIDRSALPQAGQVPDRDLQILEALQPAAGGDHYVALRVIAFPGLARISGQQCMPKATEAKRPLFDVFDLNVDVRLIDRATAAAAHAGEQVDDARDLGELCF